MGNAFVSITAHRIEVGDDWVEIKPKLGLKDRGRFASAVYQLGQTARDGEGMGIKLDIGAVAGLYLKLSVVAWSFSDPLTEASMDIIDIDEPIWAAVLKEVQERNPTLMELAAVAG